MTIVDTTFLIDIMKNNQEALKKVEELENSSEEVKIPSPVMFELWEGIQRSESPPEEKTQVMRVLESFLEIPFKFKHARAAGKRSAKLLSEGKILDPLDILIGGTAIAEDETLITRNGDFDRIPNIEIETY